MSKSPRTIRKILALLFIAVIALCTLITVLAQYQLGHTAGEILSYQQSVNRGSALEHVETLQSRARTAKPTALEK